MKTPGIYVLTLRLRRRTRVDLPKCESLPSGWYAYTGRAMGGLLGRLARHLRTRERKHWHLDALLANGQIKDIQVLPTDEPLECSVAERVRHWRGAEPVPGFGASDCSCGSHLCRFPHRPGGSIHDELPKSQFDAIFQELNASYTEHASYDRDPFETLVSCILSLRTQDPVTHAASTRLFEQMRTPAEFVQATPGQIAGLIYPVGMYRQKAERLIEIAQLIIDRHSGSTPAEIDQLMALPGVGRKTANLVRSFSFHLPAICVDTHVHRICNRWGLIRTASPDDSEFELRHLLPESHWIPINPLLVQHGQQICRPTRPRCGICPLQSHCNYAILLEETQVLSPIDSPPHPSLKLKPPTDDGKGKKMRSPFELD